MLRRLLVFAAALLAPVVSAAQGTPNVWMPIGPQFSTVLSMARNPASPNEVYAGTYFGGLYRSVDYGFNWTPVATEFSPRSIFSIGLSTSGTTIYVATFQAGVYRSADGGTTWAAVNTGLTDLDVQAVGVDPVNPDVALAATSNGGVFRTGNGGASWTRVDEVSQNLRGRAIAFHPTVAGLVYLGTIGNGVFRSVDGGLTFQPFSTELTPDSVYSLRFGAPPSRELYAATSGGAFKLRAGAAEWTDITADLPPYPVGDVLPHPVFEHVTFAATLVGVYVIPNDEAPTTWWLWNDSPTRTLDSDPTGTVFEQASVHGNLQATVDFGQTWYQANWGIQNVFVGALGVVDTGGYGPVVYAGSDSAIFRNVLGGWQTFFDQKQGIFDIQPDPSAPGTLYIGTERSGVWKSIDWGASWAASSTNLVPAQVYSLGQTVNGGMLFAGTSSGLYLSPDKGNMWVLSSEAQLGIVLSVAPDPTRFPLVFVGGANGQVLRSQDGGWSFASASNGLPPENIVALTTAPWEKTYAITGGGALYATSDDGLNWFPAGTGVAEPAMAIAADPTRAWFLYLGTNGGGVYKSESGSLTWEPANSGLTSPYVFSLAVNPASPDVVYAGTFDGVFRSSDGAATWTRVSTGLPAGAVTSLQIDSSAPTVIYASVQEAGIFRSANSGATWAAVSGIVPTAGATPLLLDQLQPTRLFAGTSLNGMYTSTDSGATWTASSYGMTLFVRGLAINPLSTNTLYAGSLGAGVFKSVDGAATWTNVGLRDRNVFKLAIDPIHPQTIYAATSRGLSRSSDGGTSWRGLGQNAAFVLSMVVDPRDRNRIFVGTTAGSVFRSVDGGQTWEEAGFGLPPLTIFALAIDPETGALYAGPERSGVWRSTNSGDAWSTFGGGLGDVFVGSLSVGANHAVYASSIGSGVFVNTGAGWTPSSHGLASPMIADVESVGGVLVAATLDAGVFRSINSGANWTWSSSGLTTSRVSSLTVDPIVASRIYAATPDGVFRSDNAGESWTAVNTGMRGVNTWSVTVDPSAASNLYAGTNGHGVYRSTNGGATWIAANTGLSIPDVRIVAPGAAGAVFAGTVGGGVSRSTNGGVTWSGAVTLDLSNSFVLAVAVNPLNPSIVYAGTAGHGVLKSTNGGVDWKPVTNGLGSLFILSLAIDKQRPDIVYAGTADSGVFVTGNGGGSWRALNDGLFNQVVTSLAVAPGDAMQVFAGTEGGGVFSAHVSLPAASCTYVPSQTSTVVASTATTLGLQLDTQPGCEWRVESGVEWLTVDGPSSRTGAGGVSITASINIGQDARSGLVTVAGTPFIVVQQGLTQLFRLSVGRTGGGSGRVSSDWLGIDCGPDCQQLFTNSLPIVLTATADQGSTFAGWEGDADCQDGQVTMSVDHACVARFEPNDDFDEDGLPNLWEVQFGLDPAIGTGDSGPSGDPDGDGRTNAQELEDGTHPRGFVTTHFATGERSTGSTTNLDLFNAKTSAAHVLVHVVPDSGDVQHVYRSIDPDRRTTIDAASLAGLQGSFAITIESDQAVVSERTIVRDSPHTTLTDVAQAAAPTWFVTGGSTRHGLSLTYVVFNPGPGTATFDVIHLPSGAPAVLRHHTLGAGLRMTIDAGSDAAAVDRDISGAIASDRPIVVDALATIASGDGLLGSLATATPGYLQYLSAGRTHPPSTSFVDVLNITGADNALTFIYVLASGGIVSRTHTAGAYQSLSINPATDDGLLQNTDFGVIVTSANPFVATARTWWPGASGDWYEGAGTVAATAAGRRWAIAGGLAGGAANSEMEIAVTNVTPRNGSVAVRLVFDDGTAVEKSFSTAALTRSTIAVAQAFPEAAFKRFSATITATGTSGGAAPDIVVEQSIYTSPGGMPWAGGTRSLATLIPQ